MATTASAPAPRKRITTALAVLACIAAGVGVMAAAAPWLFSTNVLRREVLAEIERITGLVAVAQGRSVFVVLPQPHISIEDIKFADASGALRIEARYLKGYLRVTSLLRGRLEVAWSTLGEPNIAVDLDRSLTSGGGAIGRAAQARRPRAGEATDARLGVVSVVNGSARLKSQTTDLAIDQINVTLDWRRLGAAASVVGAARFRGEGASIAASIERPIDVLRGAQSPATLKISGDALTLAAEGVLSGAPQARFTGRFTASAPSLRKLVQTGGYFVELPAPFDEFSLSSVANVGGGGASFSDLQLQLDGNQYEGALAVMVGEGKPVVSGTLATERLSLRPFLASRAPAVGREGQWSHDPFDLDWQKFADLDLRVSAARLMLPGLGFDDVALSVLNRGDRLDIALIDAKAYQGGLKGRASFTRTDAGVDLRASAVATEVDIAAVVPNSVDSWRISGALSANGAVESGGANMYDLMHNLNGHVQIALQRGELGGINLAQALRSIDKRPLGLADEFRYGGTAFERASFGLRIAKGVAEIEDGASLHSRTLDLAFKGLIDLGERALSVHAVAAAAPSAQPEADSPKFAFDVAGSFDDVVLIPDARSLIRQSGAAAPLFSPNRVDAGAAAGEGH